MSWISNSRKRALMRQAQQLLEEEGLLSLPVDLDALASTRNIVIKAMPTSSNGVSGMLTRHGNTFGILYDSSIPSEGFKRFSIAHELGHFFVEGHLDHIRFIDGVHQSHADFFSEDVHEREADCFAAGLLMPEILVRDIIGEHPDGLAAIEAVSHDARVSLIASAIRYVGLTDAATAIVVSRDGRINYCFMSDAMKSLNFDTWPKKKSSVPAETLTASVVRFPQEQRQSAREKDETDIAHWLGGKRSAQTCEEVVGLGSYNRILTVLTCPGILDETFMDEDFDSDEALEGRWAPHL